MKREDLKTLGISEDVLDKVLELHSNSVTEAVEQAEARVNDILIKADFDRQLDAAIISTKGRNATPIRSMLDVDTLRTSENREETINQALAELKHNHGYLFEDGATPPPYAAGTGTAIMPGYGTEYPAEMIFRNAIGLKGGAEHE